MSVRYRELKAPASTGDVEMIAQMHTRSWSLTYRGVFPDSYFEGGGLLKDFTQMWGERLGAKYDSANWLIMVAEVEVPNDGEGGAQDEAARTGGDTDPIVDSSVAEKGESGVYAPAGFVCVNATAEREYGILLDNLHVMPEYRRRGIARTLVQTAIKWVVQHYPEESMHLTCFSSNDRARQFYTAMGGKLYGEPFMWQDGESAPTECLRYSWTTQTLSSLV
eukprot:m.81621 g.81621  ORF g.81621 m.81621 type:complete len:221 (+) comp12648_c1_seq1:114-776(+)